MGGGAMLTPLASAVGAAAMGRGNNNNNNHLPVSSANITAPLRPTGLESIHEARHGSRVVDFYYDSVFGTAPSRIEVEKALSDLQSFLHGTCTSELAGLQHMLCLRLCERSPGYGVVDDAFRLLQTDPSVQRMVVSISSDKVVWDAIRNNSAVQNLRQSLCAAKEEMIQSNGEVPDLATLIVDWVLDWTKAKVLALIESFFNSLVNLLIQPPRKKKPALAPAPAASEITAADQLDDRVRSSLLLSVVIILIVVVTRANES